jgi:hypothetical protein
LANLTQIENLEFAFQKVMNFCFFLVFSSSFAPFRINPATSESAQVEGKDGFLP